MVNNEQRLVRIEVDGVEQDVPLGPFLPINLPTTLHHERLSLEQGALSRYAFKHVACHLGWCYEKWEVGFLQDVQMQQQLLFWTRVGVVLQMIYVDDPLNVISLFCLGVPEQWLPEVREAWNRLAGEENARHYIREAYRDAGIKNGEMPDCRLWDELRPAVSL